MKTHRRVGLAFVAGLCVAFSSAAMARQESKPEAGPGPSPYQRIVQEADGSAVRLEMAVREFAPSKDGGPRVFLAAAVHIADRGFYEKLQKFLDERDLVLFEGVKPPGAGGETIAGASEAQKQAATKRQLRFIAMAVAWYGQDHKGEIPATLKELAAGSERRTAGLLKGSLADAWGRPLQYTVIEESGGLNGAKGSRRFDIVSLGSDGEAGGEGAAADLRYGDQKPLTKSELGDRSDGIQSQLAKSMGLVFQLDAMDHDKPNWRNSDMSVDEVQARLEKGGANADGLFKMLDGSSMFGRLAGFSLGLMGSSPETRAMLRLTMIEMLGRADALMDQMPGNMGKVMEVILTDRNAVVVADLKKAIESEPKLRTIAIIYGAGHLPGIEKTLVTELGYTPAGDTWRPAMSVDAKEAGMSAGQFKQMRQMMSGMIDRQLKQATGKN